MAVPVCAARLCSDTWRSRRELTHVARCECGGDLNACMGHGRSARPVSGPTSSLTLWYRYPILAPDVTHSHSRARHKTSASVHQHNVCCAIPTYGHYRLSLVPCVRVQIVLVLFVCFVLFIFDFVCYCFFVCYLSYIEVSQINFTDHFRIISIRRKV